jgi:hypothetical protein
MDEKVKVTCMGCGKIHEVTVSDKGPQTAEVRCDCGTQTQLTTPAGKPQRMEETLKILNEIYPKVMAVLGEFRESKLKGVDTGIGEAISEVSKAIALRILEGDPILGKALGRIVRANLESYLTLPESHDTEER